MKTKFNGFLTLLLALIVQISFAQEKTVSGTISDTSGPLPGVSIVVKGTKKGAESDFDGKYSIKAKSGDVLVFRYLGYKVVEKKVSATNTINVTLEEDASVLDEVVVTAYGTTTKEALTGSIAEVKAEEFTKVASGNAITGLTGKVAGVQIYANSGQPGAAPTVRFRGIGSLNGSSNPLYVVDGVPFNESITSINPNDIETMSFLKDAAASALYGSRGANGVIILTTKKGKTGKVKINLDIKTSITDRATKDYDVMKSSGEYYEAYHRMLKNNYIAAGVDATQAGIDASNNLIDGPLGLVYNTLGGDRNTVVDQFGNYRGGQELWAADWDDTLFSNTSGVKSTYLSLSGGTESSKYFFSLGHEDNEGYNVNTGFKRYTIKANVDSDVTENLKMGLSMNYTNREQDGTLDNNITSNFAWARNIAPIYGTFAVDQLTGEYALDDAGNKQWDWANVTAPNSFGGRPYSGFSNPHALQTLNVNKIINDNFSTRAYASVDFLKNFNFTYNFGIDLRNSLITNYTNKVVGSGVAPGGRINEQFSRYTTFTNQQLLGWKNTYNDVHNLDVLLGHESSEFYGKYLYAAKLGQFINSDISMDLFAQNDGAQSVYGGPTEYNLEGYFARLLYDYDNKYYLNASFRRDGSSVFHPDNRWGNFWGAGVAWLVSKENFMNNVDAISKLKLKASIGSQGNDIVYYEGTTTRNYAPYLDQWDVVTDGTEFSPGKSDIGNQDIKWETSTNFNAGFELNMFDDRLRIESEYFKREISDLIFNRPLPSTTGFSSVPENVMSMQNVGVEASISYDIIRNNNLNWTVDLNATTYKNEITELAPGKEFIDNGAYRWITGGSAYDFFLRKYIGINPSNGHTIWATENEFEADGTTPTNGITEDSSVALPQLIGKSALPDVYGGLSTTLTYKNFDFGIDLAFQFGGYSYDNIYSAGFDGEVGRNFSRDFSETWGYDNKTTATLPRVYDGTTSYFSSDLYLQKSDYISLNNVSIGYTLPSDIINKIGMSKVRIYGVGNNLGLWTASDIQGFDPRASVTGNNSTVRYATLKTFTLGVNINF